MKRIFLLIISSSLISCSTIRFVNHDNLISDEENLIVVDKIHHIGIFGLYEYSSPVSTKRICRDNKWVYVETKHNLLTWAIASITWSVPFFGQTLGALYSPRAVSVVCHGSL